MTDGSGKSLLSQEEIKEIEATTRKIIEVDQSFASNEKLVLDEIVQADTLYDEIKRHWDTVRNYKAPPRDLNLGGDDEVKVPRTLSFIHQQTANLIALKQYKLALIKELNAMVKVKADLTLKEFIAILREKAAASDGNDGAIAQMALKMVEMLTNDDNMHVFSGNPEFEDAEVTSSLDKALDDRLKKDAPENKFDTASREDEEEEFDYPFIQIDGLEERYRFVKDASCADLYVYDSVADEYMEIDEAERLIECDFSGLTLEEDEDGNLVETVISGEPQIIEIVEFE